MDDKRETVGALSTRLLMSKPQTQDPIEIERSRQESFINCMLDFIEKERKKYHHDFYIEVQLRKEPLMPNVFRNQFYSRKSCPTPNYDQSVWKYHYIAEDLEFLWTVPDRQTCHTLVGHVLEVPDNEKELLNFVLDFQDGTLFRKMKKLNGEQDDSPLLTT